ncbi:unnamed protein product [Cylindrotheca closterium]|uniref:MCM10 OB-fold domain-containing protein n=1 Tax=Cylindrotheca closterium TaxID=2856 RepID=A0AAD2FW00_9STRA|nr:unnamed protein product [Cylindrotheca closterium]
MDELLDLMDKEERSPTNENHPQLNDNDDGMDELLDLMDDEYENENAAATSQSQSSASAVQSSNQAQVVTPPPNSLGRPKSSTQQNSQRTTKSKSVSGSVDNKLGIRMMDRQVSSVDLLDMISINPYYTPAVISAMNLNALSRLLVEPPINIDPATVTGKMNMVTVGIVFSNTGTKQTAKGTSFCILEIGNFTSGPCVTVMLFGDAYSKYVRTCGKGKVVAIVNPNLLPIREGDKTRIAVTVNNTSQFHLVAKAMDFGICKGTTRVKGSDGKWTANGNCKNWVNMQVCEFCLHHRKQREKKSKTTNAVGGSLQQLRAEGQLAVASSRFGTAGASNRLTSGLQSVPTQMKKTLADQRKSVVMQQRQQASGSNRFLNGGGTSRQVASSSTLSTQPPQVAAQSGNRLLSGGVPRQMRSQKLSNVTNRANPYSKQSNLAPTRKPKPKTGIVGNATLRGDGDWFEQGSKPKPANSRSGSLAKLANKAAKKRKLVNTDGTSGFNGSVPVPKPSQLFAGGQRQMLSNSRGPKMPDRTKSTTSIMESQARLAKMRQLAEDDKKKHLTGKSKTSSKKGALSSKDSFYANVGDIDLEKVRNTKSKFAREVEAEEYAKSRQKVVELEKLEGTKNAAKKRQDIETKSFTVEYFCKTCGTHSVFLPNSCVNAKHNVKKRRKLAQQQTKEAKRTKLHQKSAADGGLRLGAGNEWARHMKDFHS